MSQKIFIASDHAGYELKNTLVESLNDKGFEVVDKGPEEYQKGDDYPEYIIDAAEAVRDEEDSLGLVLGHSGQGEALAANKVDGVRAAVYYGGKPEVTELSRKHNDANILSLGAGFIDDEEAKREVLKWLETDFTGAERHRRRLKEISLYENRKKPQVLPALLASNQKELDRELEKVLEYSDIFHVDVQDGEFVENDSLDFDFDLPGYQRYEAHLMVEKPLNWIKENLNEFERFNFHIEAADNPESVISYLKDNDKEVGVVLNPETDLSEISSVIHEVDVVQFMTVKPGSYGSDFHREVINKITEAKRKHPEISVEVDGHVTPENIEELSEAGADLFVSGSYVQESDNPGQAVRTLEEKIEDK